MKMLALATSLCLLIVCFSADAAEAQASGPPVVRLSGQTAPPVEDLVAVALGRSSEIDVLRAKVEVAKELVVPAGALPNPMAAISYAEADFPRFSVGREPMSAVTVEYRQSLPYRGKREARSAAARADVETQGREVEALRREIARQVRTIYARIYALDREQRTIGTARELLDLLNATASIRYGVGETQQEPVIKAQLAVSKLGERTDDLAAERLLQVAALNRLLDYPLDSSLGEIDSLPPIVTPAGDWMGLAEANSAGLAVRQAEIDAAEKRLAVAKLDLKPDLTVGGSFGVRGTLPPVAMVTVGVDWPRWKKTRQEPLIRAAEREVDLARHAQHNESVELRTEIARLRAEWQRAGRQIDRYQQAILPQTSAAMDAARLAYLNGRGDFSMVFEDFGLWLDARVRLAAREADRFTTWADLQALTSGPATVSSGEER